MPTAPESLPTRSCSSARSQASAVAIELEGPDGELEAEAGRLGMDAVGAADANGAPVLAGKRHDGRERSLESLQDQLAGSPDLQRQRRVDDIRGGEPVVEPAPLLAELLADGVDEGGRVVVERGLDLAHARGIRSLRRRRDLLRVRRAEPLPSSAQPSSAASSTSSQLESLPSSDQRAAMAGRE